MEAATKYKILYLLLTILLFGVTGHIYHGSNTINGYVGGFFGLIAISFIACLVMLVLIVAGICDKNKKLDFILHLVCTVLLMLGAILWTMDVINWFIDWGVPPGELLAKFIVVWLLAILIVFLYIYVTLLLKRS